MSDSISKDEMSLEGIARFCGVPVRRTNLRDFATRGDRQGRTEEAHCLGISAQNIYRLAETTQFDSQLLLSLLTPSRKSYVYVFGFQDDQASCRAIRSLVGASDAHLLRFDGQDHKYTITQAKGIIPTELTGIQFGPIDSDVDLGFRVPAQTSYEALVSIDDCPSFIRLTEANREVFIHGVRELLDLGTAADGTELRRRFSRLIPTVLFLRHAFGDMCWHSLRHYGNLIIDDPYLRRRYGFLSYDRLEEHMDARGYSTTIAFIPWNYKRTDKRIAKVFQNRGDKLSVCVHGCDHTGAEFATADAHDLTWLVRTASQRMRLHEQMRGVPWDKVMVFPQGLFSGEAMQVLKAEGYLAAVNSGILAANEKAPSVTVEDVLDVAVMKYSGFPLFNRRYPSQSDIEFRLDFFLNKPLLGVEHHGFFRNGLDSVDRFITRTNLISDRVKWATLGTIATHTHLVKRCPDESWECRIYGPVTVIENPTDSPVRYRIQKFEADPGSIGAVSVNDRDIDFIAEEGRLTFEAVIPEHSSSAVRVVYRRSDGDITLGMNPHKPLRVWLRRRTCDLRDNYLSRSRRLAHMASLARRAIGDAGCVVTRDVPPNTVVAGNPATMLRTLDKR